MICDLEVLITAHLTDFPVVPTTPENTDEPWVRLTLLDAGQTDLPDHLAAGYVQLDCYAGDRKAWEQQAEASELARRVRGALQLLPSRLHDGAVVTGVRVNGFARNPDVEFEPARERYVITADVWAHAV